MDKQQYTSPEMTVLGTVADLTEANGNGGALDQSFPNNTPRSQLTFS